VEPRDNGDPPGPPRKKPWIGPKVILAEAMERGAAKTFHSALPERHTTSSLNTS
jgi:hypothetical protein